MSFELNLTKEQQIIIIGIAASIIVGVGVMVFRSTFLKPNTISVENIDHQGSHQSQPQLLAHISGAVRREGVYKLKPGDRVLEAINLAGGALPNADLSALNLAEAVKDGQKIDIQFKRVAQPEISQKIEEPAATVHVKGKAATTQQVININTADEKALDSLPGVGQSTAKAIIEHRKIKGPFARLEQIMEIPRFGKNKFERLKGRIII